MKICLGILFLGASILLQGCVAAPFVAGGAALGASVAGNKAASETTTTYLTKVEKMNCAQLRKEYDRLDSNIFGNLGSVTPERKFLVYDMMKRKRCRLPA